MLYDVYNIWDTSFTFSYSKENSSENVTFGARGTNLLARTARDFDSKCFGFAKGKKELISDVGFVLTRLKKPFDWCTFNLKMIDVCLRG